MENPGFITAAPGLDVPIPGTVVKTHVCRLDARLVVMFDVLQGFALPSHAQRGQWGTVVSGTSGVFIQQSAEEVPAAGAA
jgi:hypothetical protein